MAAQPSKKISVEDYVAIQQLYAEFNTALDTGQADRYAATWTEDGEFTGGRTAEDGSKEPVPRTPNVRGKDQIWQMGQRGGTGSRHFVANLVVTPTADGATATAHLILMNAHDTTISATAIYNDTLVKTKDGWKFKKRINWRDVDPKSPYKPKPMQAPPGAPGAGPPPPSPGAR
jgi:hypothetical protein